MAPFPTEPLRHYTGLHVSEIYVVEIHGCKNLKPF